MTFSFLFVGGQKEAWLEEFAASYTEKIARHYKTEIVRLKPIKHERAAAEQKRKAETEALLARLKPSDFLVLFDERGKALTSVQFAKQMEAWLARGKSRLVFCVGGAFGFDESLRQRADALISLSTMVLNHHVAQMVAMEQVYRAIAIQKHLPYHNEG